MKVLLISTNSDEAGAPRHVEAIVQGLGDEFQFILVFGESGPVCDRLSQRGCIVHVVPEMRTAIHPGKDLIALAKVIRLIKKHQPDVIHCHSAKAGMLGRISAFLCGVNWIYTVHGWGWRGTSKMVGNLIIFIESILSKLPGGHYLYVADAVRTEAENVLSLNKDRGSIVYNGVSPIIVEAPQTATPFVILMPARVSSAKDHQSMILAFEKFDDPEAILMLCGTGTNTAEFEYFAKKLAPKNGKNILFLGQRSDIAELYAQAHVVALISHFEALPLSIIEAMSCARPVIGTNVGGVPELIEHEVNGFLVRPRCVDDIVKSLIALKDDQFRHGMSTRANTIYLSKFTCDTMLSSIADKYRKFGSNYK